MRRAILAALIFLALGPVPGTHFEYAEETLIERAAATPLARPRAATGTLRFVRGWHLTSPHSRFGGFSALALIGPDRFQLVGDNGEVVRLTIGAGSRVEGLRIAPLPQPAGWPRRKSMIDTESLFVDPASGESWTGLENINQIWRFDAGLTRVEARYSPQALHDWPRRRGPEAMTRLADGRIILFSEGGSDDPRENPAAILPADPAAKSPPAITFFYDAEGKGAVSDAATLPDGHVLLVHRRVNWTFPVFTTLLSIADPADIRAGGVLRSRTIGRIPEGIAENYEGAAIEEADGRIFLWLVSDNNFQRWQRSLLVQFELVDLPPRRKPDSKKAAR